MENPSSRMHGQVDWGHLNLEPVYGWMVMNGDAVTFSAKDWTFVTEDPTNGAAWHSPTSEKLNQFPGKHILWKTLENEKDQKGTKQISIGKKTGSHLVGSTESFFLVPKNVHTERR